MKKTKENDLTIELAASLICDFRYTEDKLKQVSYAMRHFNLPLSYTNLDVFFNIKEGLENFVEHEVEEDLVNTYFDKVINLIYEIDGKIDDLILKDKEIPAKDRLYSLIISILCKEEEENLDKLPATE